MRTIFTITGRKFTTPEFAKKFADKNNLDYSLISGSQEHVYLPPNNIFIKENQASYLERHARMAK
jgi:peroxiredoxin